MGFQREMSDMIAEQHGLAMRRVLSPSRRCVVSGRTTTGGRLSCHSIRRERVQKAGGLRVGVGVVVVNDGVADGVASGLFRRGGFNQMTVTPLRIAHLSIR